MFCELRKIQEKFSGTSKKGLENSNIQVYGLFKMLGMKTEI